MHLGRKIKIARIAKEMTQQDLADKIGKTRPLVSSIEQTGQVSVHTLRDICKVLEVDIDDITAPDTANDPLFQYKSRKTKEQEDQLKLDNKKLLAENQMLKDFIESQKEVIRMLKAEQKLKTTPKKR